MSLHDDLLAFWGRLHIGEVIRRRALRRALQPLLHPGMRVLDAGCGRGDNARWIAQRYADVQVDAVDIDPACTALVERRAAAAGLRNLRVRTADLTSFESDTRYAIVYSVDVFEHLRDPRTAIRRLAEVIAAHGWLILHVPREHQRRWFRRFRAYHQEDHEREGFEPELLTRILEDAGFTVTATRHTFGPPGALAWECFHLLQGIGRPFVLLAYPFLAALARIDGWVSREQGNGMLVVAQLQHADASGGRASPA